MIVPGLGVELSEFQINAMQAIFDLCEAMDKGDLSIRDLVAVISVAAEKDSLTPLIIRLAMVTHAVKMV